ncbi:HAMP domain-containing histidine kinase [bacterium]|nr:HAMP domain-containing histidine kinase [bacterium]
MRLRILIALIIIYILAAFAWLTFSLLDYSNSDYRLKNDVLKAGLNACILQVVEKAKNGELGNDTFNTYYLKQLKLELEPVELITFVKNEFNNNYSVDVKYVDMHRVIQIDVNQEKLRALQKERDEQKKIWIFQSVLLFLLVSAGVYGVYSTINNITALNKRQNNFLLSVTHEFKTPIAAIRLMLQTALNPKVPEGKKDELIENSIQNTHRLEELTENMLTATQMESDRYEMELGLFSLSELCLRIIKNYSIRGEIEANVEEEIEIEGDEFVLRIAISNLVENAFKYSDNAPIAVDLYRDGKVAVLEIRDQGVGIPKKEYSKIFRKFYRVQDEETRTTKGTGLGLFIVKQTIQRHQGSIWASANEPRGTVFTVRLPLKQS